MKPKVFISKPIPRDVEEYIGKHCEYDIWQESEPISEKEFLERVKGVDGIMAPHAKVDERLLDAAPNLKIISNIAVGYENFDIEFMKEKKIMGTHTPHVLDETVADLAFGLILTTARKISYLDRYTKSGNWKKIDDSEFLGSDVNNKTLGIIGMGRIGQKIAKRAALGFDMKILYNSRSRKEDIEREYGASYCEIEELLENSDFVLVMLPYTKETDKIIAKREFDLMKETGFFINASRGKIVNEKDLIQALKNKSIAGAGLDVYESEPLSMDNPLLKMDNVVTTPHMGSATRETRHAMATKAGKNLVMGLNGETPTDLVPELKDTF